MTSLNVSLHYLILSCSYKVLIFCVAIYSPSWANVMILFKKNFFI